MENQPANMFMTIGKLLGLYTGAVNDWCVAMDKPRLTRTINHKLHTFCAQTLRIQALLDFCQGCTDVGIQA